MNLDLKKEQEQFCASMRSEMARDGLLGDVTDERLVHTFSQQYAGWLRAKRESFNLQQPILQQVGVRIAIDKDADAAYATWAASQKMNNTGHYFAFMSWHAALSWKASTTSMLLEEICSIFRKTKP